VSKTRLNVLASAAFTLVAIVALAFAFLGGVAQEAHAQDAQKGLDVVNKNGCVGCHGGAQLTGGIGPKLAGTSLTQDQFLAKVRSGGGRMPPFAASQVSDADVASVYAYARSLGGAAQATTAAATTAAATTAAATTAAATTAAATTAAATTAAPATTAAATTAAATTTAATSTGFALPPTPSITEVTLPASIGQAFSKQLGAAASSAALKFYVSNETSRTLATTLNTAVTGSGYRALLPNGFQDQNGTLGGVYTKTSSPDVVVILVDVPANSQEITKGLTVSQQDADAFVKQVAGRKTLVVVLSGNNLISALGAATTTAAATTRAATTAAATTAAGGQGGAPTGAPSTGIGGPSSESGFNALWLLLPFTLLSVMSGVALVARSRRVRR
jgi:cytochrome c551/c552